MQYDLVIVGATIAALGLAETVKKDQKVLIINQTEMTAYEFVNSYKLPGIYSKGAEYHKRFHDLAVDILLNSEITDIQARDDGCQLEIFSGTGFYTVQTKRIVDTTGSKSDITGKSLNCLLVNKSKDELIEDSFDGVSFIHEPDDNLGIMIMKYECPIEMSIMDARHRLIDFWRGRPEKLRQWKIAAIGFCFEVQPACALKEISPNHILLSSVYYNTPEESFEAGVELGRRLRS